MRRWCCNASNGSRTPARCRSPSPASPQCRDGCINLSWHATAVRCAPDDECLAQKFSGERCPTYLVRVSHRIPARAQILSECDCHLVCVMRQPLRGNLPRFGKNDNMVHCIFPTDRQFKQTRFVTVHSTPLNSVAETLAHPRPTVVLESKNPVITY